MSCGLVFGQMTAGELDKRSDSRNLRVMSYNMRIASPPSMDWKGTDLLAISDVINRTKPDLVALQEVDAFTQRSGKSSHQAKELAKLTGMYYYFAKAIDRSDGDYGVAVLSRFPIIEGKGYRLPISEDSKGEIRGMALILIEALGKEIVFASAHFDHMTDRDRLLQATKVIEILKPYSKYPIILGADLNMEPDNKVMDVMRREFRTCVDCPLTFPQIDPKVTIDYIMTNKLAAKQLRMVKYQTVAEDYASDHLPLIADFQLED